MNQRDVEGQLTEQFLTYEEFKNKIELKILKNDGKFMNLRDECNVIEKRIYELEKQMELTQKVIVAKLQGNTENEDQNLQLNFSIFQDKNQINNDLQRERKQEEYFQQQLENVNRLFDLFQKNSSVFDDDPTSKGLIDCIIMLGKKIMQQLVPENNQYNNLRLKQVQNTVDNQIKIKKFISNEQADMIQAINNSLNSQLQMLENNVNNQREDYLRKFSIIQVEIKEMKEKLVSKDDIDQLLEAQYKASMQSFLDEDEKQKKEFKKLIDEQNKKIQDLCIKQYSAENLQKQNIEKQFQDQIAGIISKQKIIEDQQLKSGLQDEKYQNLENRLSDIQKQLDEHINQYKQQYKIITFTVDWLKKEVPANQQIEQKMETLKTEFSNQVSKLEAQISPIKLQKCSCDQTKPNSNFQSFDPQKPMLQNDQNGKLFNKQSEDSQQQNTPQTRNPFQSNQNLGTINNTFQANQQQNIQRQVDCRKPIQTLQNVQSQPNIQNQNFSNNQNPFQIQAPSKFPLGNQQPPQQPSSIKLQNTSFPQTNQNFSATQFQPNPDKQPSTQPEKFFCNFSNQQQQGSNQLDPPKVNEIGNIQSQLIVKQQNQKEHPDKFRLKIVQENINNLYNQTCRKRSAQGDQQLFVKDLQNLQELYRYYGVRSSEQKKILAQICNCFRQARGDGNCFYTSFGFQFFQILLVNYDVEQFKKFMTQMDQIITFQLNFGQGQQFDLKYQFWEELKYRLNYLRKIEDVDLRIQEFVQHYAAYDQNNDQLIDGCFYALSTIFFRNLANHVINNSEMKQTVFDQQNLLIWEEECNSNEVVIQELATYLKVNVQLLFFENGTLTLREYSQAAGQHKIILLIKPGHYNAGFLDDKKIVQD